VRRRRLGRQLVLPDIDFALRPRPGEHWPTDPGFDRHSRCARCPRRHGKDGAPIEHVEIFGPPKSREANSRNFVLCPGGAFDRSPCGTGTSAKLACLHADRKLRPSEVWVQESIIGSRFSATFEPGPNGGVLPRISGRAFVCAESKLLENPADPFRYGFGDQPA